MSDTECCLTTGEVLLVHSVDSQLEGLTALSFLGEKRGSN